MRQAYASQLSLREVKKFQSSKRVQVYESGIGYLCLSQTEGRQTAKPRKVTPSLRPRPRFSKDTATPTR